MAWKRFECIGAYIMLWKVSLKDHLVNNIFIAVQSSVKQTTLHQLGLRTYFVSNHYFIWWQIYQKGLSKHMFDLSNILKSLHHQPPTLVHSDSRIRVQKYVPESIMHIAESQRVLKRLLKWRTPFSTWFEVSLSGFQREREREREREAERK